MSFQLAAHVVDDPPAQGQPLDAVALDRRGVAEPLGRPRRITVVLERRRLVGQAHPRVAEPLAQLHRHSPCSTRSTSGIFCRLGAATSVPSSS